MPQQPEYPPPTNELMCPYYAFWIDDLWREEPDITAEDAHEELQTDQNYEIFPVSLTQVRRRLAFLNRKHLNRACKQHRTGGNGSAFDYEFGEF